MTDELNEYKWDYKTFFKEFYNLNESPKRIDTMKFSIDDIHNNSYEAIRVEENDKLVGKYNFINIQYRHYYSNENGIIFEHLLDIDRPIIYLAHSYEKTTLSNKNGIVNLSIWKSKHIRSLAVYWAFDEILKKYDFIISDKAHTPRGETYWKTLTKEALSKNMVCAAIDTLQNNQILPIKTIDEFTQYYGDNKSKYRIVIFK